jgi:glycosyltransferase involved in cell wall biosynthesis
VADTGAPSANAGDIHACSIVARNYLPQARVLASSWARHHPGAPLELLVLDDTEGTVDDRDEPFVLVRPAELAIDEATWDEMAFIYDVTELATAVKPSLLTLLRGRHGGPVAYIDPDIEVFGPLEQAATLAREHPIVLTPHMLEPAIVDGRRPTEHDILGCGVYNLGFICVGDGSERFLEWWADRLRYHAIVDFRSSLFTDQRWVDFVPGYFDFVALRNPAYNVAYWNLPDRFLHEDAGRWFVGDEPLVFFHYSGYEPDRPWAVSKHLGGEPRVLFSERPDVLELCRSYEAQLRISGFGSDTSEYAYNRLPTGAKLNTRMRRLYRSALLESASFDDPPPPMPFTEDGADRVLAWLNSPSALFEGSAPQSRYLESIWQERDDLKLSFPHVHGEDSDGFVEWVHAFGGLEEDIPPEMVPTGQRTSPHAWARPGRLRPGITVAGYFRGELGMGEAARSILAAVDATGLEHATVVVNRTYSRQDHPHDQSEGPYDLDTAIAVINADQVRMFQGAVGPGFFAGRRTVGFWAWELEEFPPEMLEAAALFDEIWASSTFAATSLLQQIDKPVHVFPLAVSRPKPTEGSLPMGVPTEGFLFLFMFDYLSVFERKNPLGVIEAFSKAFAPSEGPVLVVKSVNGDLRRLDRERVRLAAADRPDIVLIDEYVTKGERDALLIRADAYVSLHRAEGFGLTMAESMIMGKPVIATGYSGNLDFMTEENSFLVPYELGTVPPGCDPYPPGTPWAEPDVDGAAQMMRLVVDEPDLAARKAAVASADITRTHGLPVATAFVQGRFDALAARYLERQQLTANRPRRSTLPRRVLGGASRRLVRYLQRLDNRR